MLVGVQAPGASLRGIGVVLRQVAVMVSLAITALYFAAVFTMFSFIVLVLRALTPLSAGEWVLTLMLFGSAGLFGMLLGGYCYARLSWMSAALVVIALMLLALQRRAPRLRTA